MKGLFFLLCVICAGLSSAVIILMSNDQQQEVSVSESQPKAPSLPPVSISIYPEQARAVEDMTAAIIARQEDLDRKEASLRKLETDLNLRTALMTRLQTELLDAKQSMEQQLLVLDENQRKNSRKLAEFYSQMEAGNAARLLSEIEPQRAALLLTFLSDRQAGKIMDAAITLGDDGIERAVEWTEIIREMKQP